MTDTNPQYRARHDADPDRVEVREGEDDGDGLFRVRMPVSSTTEARDGDAFTRERLSGFRDQIEAGDIGVFLDHGRNVETGSRYSALGKVGYWDAPALEERDGVTDLMADAVLADPAGMDDDVGDIREMLAWLKTQAEVGIPLSSSVGWDESTGDRDVPGGADLLEISIVGIPSDPRTTTASAEPAAMARAVSAASSDFDVGEFVRALESETRNTVEVGGEEIDLTPPDAVANAAAVALAKDDELEPDCGTGAGRQSAQAIAGGSVTAERIDDIAAYLTSHEEDVTAEGPPSDWSDEEWSDCGNLQYAKWGGTGTGTGLEWGQSKANAVAEAAGEELPYPERATMTTDTHNLNDPEFGVGDGVMWSSNDTSVHGRVAEVGDEFEPADGVTITGDEGEAVYLIHELDDSLSPPQYRRENVAKPQSSLDESTMDLPPTEGNFADDENSMSEDDTEPDAESGTDTDEQSLRGMEEKMDEMREMLDENTRMCEEMYEQMMGDGEEEGEESESDPEGESDADADDGEARTITIDGEERSVEDVRDEIADLREQTGAESAESKTENRASEEGETTDGTAGFGMAARAEE